MDDLRKKQFIEVTMQWEGELTAKTLQDHFEISRTTAQAVIKSYQDEFPENKFIYCQSTRKQTPLDTFSPKLTKGTLNEYLSFYGESLSHQANQAQPNNHLELLPLPVRNINPTLVRKMVKACKENLRIDIDYFSMSSGQMEGRIICPHTLVNDGIRWHVRAYCEKNRDYRDFVLSRFGSSVEYEDKSQHTKQDDKEWNMWLSIVLQPDVRLSSIKQKAIEMDYMMKNGQLEINCRAALIKYLLQRLRVDTYHHKPEGQQIIIEPNSWDALKPYRMNN